MKTTLVINPIDKKVIESYISLIESFQINIKYSENIPCGKIYKFIEKEPEPVQYNPPKETEIMFNNIGILKFIGPYF